ncbi:MAG: hypothetical protein WC815_15480 [Vicinamibacterales bacterium]
MGWGKKIGIGCASAFGLLAVFVIIVFLVVRTLTSEPEQVVRQFLTDAAAGNYVAAHAAFSVPLKERQSLDAFTATVKSSPSLFAVADTTFTERSIDTAGAKFVGTVTIQAGTKVPASFTLVKENDAWKLLEYHLGSKE